MVLTNIIFFVSSLLQRLDVSEEGVRGVPMWPGPPSVLDTHSVKMLAVLEEWNGEGGVHVDNTSRYLYLILFKLGLDTTILYLCWRRLHSSFLSMCGLSIVLADALMVVSLATVWFLNPSKSPVSVCFILALFSAAFSVLPLPMLSLGVFDYFTQDKCYANHRPLWMTLRNMALALLVWLLAAVYSYVTATNYQMEIEHYGGLKAVVCEVQESPLVNYLVVGLLMVIICSLLPHYSAIPAWHRKATWLSDQRDQPNHIQKSDLLHSTAGPIRHEDAEAEALVKTAQRPPALWISLMLGFASVWLPYLCLSVLFVLLGFGIPAYIMINLLWLECTNSLLVGVVFWVKSQWWGQYNRLPDDVCMWRTYLHLSRATDAYQRTLHPSHETASVNTVSHQFDHAVTHY